MSLIAELSLITMESNMLANVKAVRTEGDVFNYLTFSERLSFLHIYKENIISNRCLLYSLTTLGTKRKIHIVESFEEKKNLSFDSRRDSVLRDVWMLAGK